MTLASTRPWMAAALLLLASCSSRDPGRQDSKPADDRHEQAASSPGSGSEIAAAAAPSDIALSERHADARFGFELSFPSGWTAGEGEMPAFFVASPREGEADEFVENVNVVVEPLTEPMSANAYADGSEALIAADLGAYQLIARSEVELGDRPAVRREYEHVYLGRPLWVVSYLLVVDRRGYVITATAEREHAELWRARLEAIASSFRITSAASAG
ncbi:DcrB-related protein [Nannocystaceae bacterium ST9]